MASPKSNSKTAANKKASEQDFSEQAKQFLEQERHIPASIQEALGIRWESREECVKFGFSASLTPPTGAILFPLDGTGKLRLYIAKPFYPDKLSERRHITELMNAELDQAEAEKREPKQITEAPKYLRQTGSHLKKVKAPYPMVYSPYCILNPDEPLPDGQTLKVLTEDLVGAIRLAAMGIRCDHSDGVDIVKNGQIKGAIGGASHPAKVYDVYLCDADWIEKHGVRRATIRTAAVLGIDVGSLPISPDGEVKGVDEWVSESPNASPSDFEQMVTGNSFKPDKWQSMMLNAKPFLVERGFGDGQATLLSSELRESALGELVGIFGDGAHELGCISSLPEKLRPTKTDVKRLGKSHRSSADGKQGSKEDHLTADEVIDELVKIATKEAELFSDDEGQAYADVEVNGCRHTYPVEGREFTRWATHLFYSRWAQAPSGEAVKTMVNTACAVADFNSAERRVWLRTAEFDSKIYIDLCNEKWQAIEVDSLGWRVIDRPPVRFVRPPTALPLPTPESGGDISLLRDLMGLNGPEHDDTWLLLLWFSLFCYMPGRTYPVLFLTAPRGSAKSTKAEQLKSFIDPSKAPLMGLKSDRHAMGVAGRRRWLMAYDNLSSISPNASDLICQVATGFGFSTRTLFSTMDETIVEFTRPQIITAIDHVVTRDDLADRALVVPLPRISDGERKTKRELDEAYAESAPQILGALMDLLSGTLSNWPDTHSDWLPRMADFGLFSMASEPSIGLAPGTFKRVFEANRQRAQEAVLHASPFAELLIEFMTEWADGNVYTHLMSELLSDLKNFLPGPWPRTFPQSTRGLSQKITRLKPELEAIGLFVKDWREDSLKRIEITKVGFGDDDSGGNSDDDSGGKSDDDLGDEPEPESPKIFFPESHGCVNFAAFAAFAAGER